MTTTTKATTRKPTATQLDAIDSLYRAECHRWHGPQASATDKAGRHVDSYKLHKGLISRGLAYACDYDGQPKAYTYDDAVSFVRLTDAGLELGRQRAEAERKVRAERKAEIDAYNEARKVYVVTRKVVVEQVVVVAAPDAATAEALAARVPGDASEYSETTDSDGNVAARMNFDRVLPGAVQVEATELDPRDSVKPTTVRGSVVRADSMRRTLHAAGRRDLLVDKVEREVLEAQRNRHDGDDDEPADPPVTAEQIAVEIFGTDGDTDEADAHAFGLVGGALHASDNLEHDADRGWHWPTDCGDKPPRRNRR